MGSRIGDDWQENCCTTHLLARKWGHMYNTQQSYHNEHTHFCREMFNIVNTRFLRPFGVIMEITTKSPQKLYNGSFFGPFFTQKSFCREMCNIVNTRFLRPFGVSMEITTKSP